jgi:hypothetical protein
MATLLPSVDGERQKPNQASENAGVLPSPVFPLVFLAFQRSGTTAGFGVGFISRRNRTEEGKRE